MVAENRGGWEEVRPTGATLLGPDWAAGAVGAGPGRAGPLSSKQGGPGTGGVGGAGEPGPGGRRGAARGGGLGVAVLVGLGVAVAVGVGVAVAARGCPMLPRPIEKPAKGNWLAFQASVNSSAVILCR